MIDFPAQIISVLGPTNTGKTHYAIERMLAHKTGIIGLPLRLLAREVYDRIVALRGPSVVALVTGEERIVPARTQYWVCTVEAMPLGMGVDFVAIDEIQLCADPDRGHVFTDRLLHMRGLAETLFLGSDTMKGVIGQLVPKSKPVFRDRFSILQYTGEKKLSRLPRRSAIVGFSVDNVYAIAELIRRQKGGAAIVMGALSPRTRNAQVEMYQNGDVDYLVATDAIGMGLNLDVTHVAFSSLSKFDGRQMRMLAPNELAQIAGRAGRYLNSGTFGVTGDACPLDQEVVDAIENHRFTPMRALQWRSFDLRFGTVQTLIESLTKPSENSRLLRAREADDLLTLRALAEMPEITNRIQGPLDVQLLWDVCQIPDFRNISATEHAMLVARLYRFLHQGSSVSSTWMAARIREIDNTTGGIDALSKRLAFIRTWTYVAQRKNWVEDENHWRGEALAVEDRLSDALHRALTQRFVDRRTSILMRRLKQKERLVADVNKDGEVRIEGQFVGKLSGFRFVLDEAAEPEQVKTLRSAAFQALKPEYFLRTERLYNAPDGDFALTPTGDITWGGADVGKLLAGGDILSPLVEVFVDDEAGVEVSEKIRRRLSHFIDRKIAALFEPLLALKADETIAGLARGVGFRLVESLGVIPRSVIAEDLRGLDQEQRGLLRKHGMRFGQYTIFQHLMLKPAATQMRLILWSLQEGLNEVPQAPPPGLVTIPALPGAPKGYYTRAGYRLAGSRAVRIDMLERLADQIRVVNPKIGFEATTDMLSITGTTLEQFADLMSGLGYKGEKGEREKVKPLPLDPQNSEGAETDPVESTSVKEETQTETSPQAETESSDSPQEAGPQESAEPEMEVFYVFSWEGKPRRTGQAKTEAGKKRPPKGANKIAAKKSSSHKAAPPKKQQKIDPDNPFAALMALKK